MSLINPRDRVSEEQQIIIDSIFDTLDMEQDYYKRAVSKKVMDTIGAELRASIRSVVNSNAVFAALSENMPWSEALYVLGEETYESTADLSATRPLARVKEVVVDDGSGARPFKMPKMLPSESIADEKKTNFVIYTFRSVSDDEVFVVRIKNEVNGFIRHAYDFSATDLTPVKVLKISLAADLGINPYSLGFTDGDELPGNVVALPKYTAASAKGERAYHHPFLINLPYKMRIIPTNLTKYTDAFWADDVLVEGQAGLHSSGNGFVKAVLKAGVSPTVSKPKGVGIGRGAPLPARGGPSARGGPFGRGAPRGRGFGRFS